MSGVQENSSDPAPNRGSSLQEEGGKRTRRSWDRLYLPALLFLTGVGLALRLCLLGQSDLTVDEFYSVGLLHKPWSEFLQAIGKRGPLCFLFQLCIMKALDSDSPMVMRLAPAIIYDLSTRIVAEAAGAREMTRSLDVSPEFLINRLAIFLGVPRSWEWSAAGFVLLGLGSLGRTVSQEMSSRKRQRFASVQACPNHWVGGRRPEPVGVSGPFAKWHSGPL